ncbi:PAS domain-containing protein [Dawidia soli]|uniref:histidine kinase n=1 Tax=Dawidia soli TaxID=2782352 RepID=A0AAP2GL98_9BACT|nr:PAS domain-containing protein [Dawidia soli]MBT1689888.1 PAS domain-containing protein [Dawidia soli]
MENIISLLVDGLLVLNADNCIEIGNDISLKMLGFSTPSEIKGKHITSLYAYPGNAEKIIRLMGMNSHLYNCEDTFITPYGQSFLCSYSCLQFRNPDGVTFSKIILLRDLTDKMIAEQKISVYTKRLNASTDQLKYLASHELTAPLQAIYNLILWLQEDTRPSLSEENINIHIVKDRVTRFGFLINDLLKYSTVGQSGLNTSAVDLYTIVTDVTEMLSDYLVGSGMPSSNSHAARY